MNRAIGSIAISGVLVASVLLMRRPMEATMPAYGVLAERLSDAPVAESFEPLGYSFLIASMPGDTIDQQAKRLHFVCYLVLAALTGWCLSRTAASHPLASTMAAAAILFNPYVLINLFRLNDNNVNVPAIAALFMVLRWSMGIAEAHRPRLLACASALLGVVMSVRPNALTLMGVLGPVGGMREWVAGRRARAAASALTVAGIAALAYLACAWTITGRPLFWPSNGPYNLFAGNNPASMSMLVSEYNAETSLPMGLRWCGIDQPLRSVDAATFTSCTIRFWKEHPVQTLSLAAMKFYTMMFRPNLRLADSPFEVALQLATMVLPLAWWAAAAAVALRRREVIDPLALAFVVLYTAPFVLTNSDPRFRLPLDAVYALSLASPSVLAKLRHAGAVLPA